MIDYPLQRLLLLGPPRDPWPDYLRLYGIVTAHVPHLIRLATRPMTDRRAPADPDADEELTEDESGDQDIYPEDFANVHAWRALAQMRAVEALPPLFQLFTAPWRDNYPWIDDDLPQAIGLWGLAAYPFALELFKNRPQARSAAIACLLEIAQQPSVDPKYCLAPLVEALSTTEANDPELLRAINRLRPSSTAPANK